MKLRELTYDDQLITEDMLTEGLIDDKIKPLMTKVFSRKAKNVSKYQSQYKAAIAKAKQDAASEGVDTKAVETVVKTKVKGDNPKKLSTAMIKKQLREILDELKQQNKFEVVSYSLIIFIVIFLIGTTMNVVFTPIVGAAFAPIMTAVFVSPVTEEIGKFISIKYEATGAFLIGFNIAEYLIYMSNAAVMGISLSAMAALRLLPVAMHTLWTVIMRDKYQSGGKVPVVKTTALHMLYNAFPVIGAPMTLYYAMKPSKHKNDTQEVVT